MEQDFSIFVQEHINLIRRLQILLLTAALIQSGGFLLLFGIQNHFIRQHQDHLLSKAKPLLISSEQYNAGRIRENEIRLDGKMYDILKTELKGSEILLLAVHDEEEEGLLEEIGKFLSHSAGRSHGGNNTVIRLAFSPFGLPENLFVPEPSHISGPGWISLNCSFFPDQMREVPNPPPDFS